jgi:carbohydrate-selective porin OprB
MRRTVAALAVCGIVAGVAASLALSASNRRPAPNLGLAKPQPLTLAGRNFRPQERVRVTATVAGRKRRQTVTAGQTGRLHVVFRQLGWSRCDSLRVVAVRRSGALVVLKRLPAPACSAG